MGLLARQATVSEFHPKQAPVKNFKYPFYGAPAGEVAGFFRKGAYGLFASVQNPIGRHTLSNDTTPALVATVPHTAGTGLTATAPAFDIKPGYACGNEGGKYKFIGNVTSLQACEAACTAEPICVQFEHRSDTNPGNHWCALYNTTSTPIPNAKFDTGCRGTCTTRPG